MLGLVDLGLMIPVLSSCFKPSYDGDFLTSIMLYPSKPFALDIILID
jgi:hypothetical protein